MTAQTGKLVFLFAFSNKLSEAEKSKYEKIIKKLGGEARVNEDMYVSDASYIITPNQDPAWCPKIIGALAGCKPVLTTDYLIQSDHAGKLLPISEEFIPFNLRELSEKFRRYGKPFSGLKTLVVVKNVRRRTELKIILRDGGAIVQNWILSDLGCKPKEDLAKLDIVYTDDVLSEYPAIEKFYYDRKDSSECRPLKVLSYFSIFKLVQSGPKNEKERELITSQFDVTNLVLMAKLHNSKVKSAHGLFNAPKRQAKKTTVITIASSDEEQDNDEIQFVGEVKKREMTEDVQYISRGVKPRSPIIWPEIVEITSGEESDGYTVVDSDNEDQKSEVKEVKPTTVCEPITVNEGEENEKKRKAIRHFGSSPASTAKIEESEEPKKKKFRSFGAVSADSFDMTTLQKDTIVAVTEDEKKENIVKTDDVATKTSDDDITDKTSDYKEKEEVDSNGKHDTKSVMNSTSSAKENEAFEKVKKVTQVTKAETSVSSVKVPKSKTKTKVAEKSNSIKKKEKTLQTFDFLSANHYANDMDESVIDEEDLRVVSSKDLNEEQISQYVRAFTYAQTERKLGLEMDEVILKDQPRFDKHREGSKMYELDKETKNPKLKVNDELELFFDDFKGQKQMEAYFLQLEILKYGLASCLYYPADRLKGVIDKIRTLKAKSKELHYLGMEEVMEVIDQQQILHPIIRDAESNKVDTKNYYKDFFGGDFLAFFKEALKDDSSRLDAYLLDFAVEVFKQDYVGQHKRSKMVEKICGQQADFVIQNLKSCASSASKGLIQHRKFTLHRLVNLISMFMADIDASQGGSSKSSIALLNSMESEKTCFGLIIYRHFFKQVKSIQELFVRSFLIRPTWLSTLALIKTLKNFKSTTQELPNNSSSLYPELKDLLKELPDKPHEKLARANTDLQLMFMFYLHQTIPAVTISRIMLVDHKGLSGKVKWMPLKLRDPKPLSSKVIFDNNVGIKSKNLTAIIKASIDLLNQMQNARRVEQPYQVWHFL